MDANGVPKKDRTLKHPRCVFQILKQHFSRYNVDLVSKISGTPRADLLEIYKTYGATGAKGKSGTIMYAMGWTYSTKCIGAHSWAFLPGVKIPPAAGRMPVKPAKH
jgi:formate dehydrogenase major subunit